MAVNGDEKDLISGNRTGVPSPVIRKAAGSSLSTAKVLHPARLTDRFLTMATLDTIPQEDALGMQRIRGLPLDPDYMKDGNSEYDLLSGK